MWRLFLSALFVLMGAALCGACTCARTHPQDYLCNSDFVVRASVLSVNKPDENAPYQDSFYVACQLRVLSVFKHPQNSTVLKSDTKNVTLHVDNEWIGTCGFTPQLRTKYVFAGDLRDDLLHVNLCDLHTPWEELTKQQRRGFYRKYRKNCMCHVKTCAHCDHIEANECMWSHAPPYTHGCYASHGVCEQRDTGDCEWSNPADLRRCKREALRKYREKVNASAP